MVANFNKQFIACVLSSLVGITTAPTLGAHSNATGELDKANQTYKDWIEIYPRNIAARINLGLNYMRLGDWDKALQETQERSGLTLSFLLRTMARSRSIVV